jgi:hypothetical protein
VDTIHRGFEYNIHLTRMTPIRSFVPIDWNAISQTDSFAKIIRVRKLQFEQMQVNGRQLLQSLQQRLEERIREVAHIPHKRRSALALQRRLETVKARLSELESRKDEQEFEEVSQSYVIAHARQMEQDVSRPSVSSQHSTPATLTPGTETSCGLVVPASKPTTGVASSNAVSSGSRGEDAVVQMDVNKTGDIVHQMYKAISEMADDKQMPVTIRNAGEIVQQMLSAISAAPVVIKAARSNMCRFCNVPLLISTESQLKICPNCRSSACYANSTSSAMQYGEGYESRCTWYPPGSHLNEVLTKQTGRTRSDISLEVQTKIAKELLKMGFSKNSEITQGAVHVAVHNLGLGNAVYKHIPQLTNQLSGRPIPQFTRSQSIQIRIAYRVLQRLFSIMYVGTHQFFTAKFVMYKLCQMFGWTEMFECFPLTSGIDNVDKSTALWNTMMRHLGWPVIPNYVE